MNSLISYLTLAVITLFQPIFPKGHHRLRVQGGKSCGYHLLRVGTTLQNMGEMIGFDSSPLEF